MDANELTALSACDIARGAARGDFRPAEVARAFLARAAARTDLNAFLRLADDEEIDDQCRANGDATKKFFVPVALKDIFCVKGQPTTCASRMLENFRPTYDAAVVENLRAAAMPIIGKTNMDEFAMGSSGENSAFGATKNPWDLSRSPGGSSSGAAAAVAARLCPLAIGTDTGGSVRQPAAFCGVTAIKPTYGRISRWGMIAFASSFDQAGVIARDAADCALGLSALCCPDFRDSTSRPFAIAGEDFIARSNAPLTGRTIGVPNQFFADGLDDETAQKTKDAIGVFESLGAKIVALDMPALDLGVAAYYVLSAAEASSNLSRYDGVRYGLRVEGETLEEMYQKTRAAGFGREVKRRILLGAYALSYGYRDEYYRRAAKIRHLVANDFERAFAQCDFIAGPTTPGPAFQLGEMRNDPTQMYRQDIYTAPVNLVGLPAMSVPCGFVRGLPVGLHLIGRGGEEAKLLACARRFQEATDYHLQTPPAPTAATR